MNKEDYLRQYLDNFERYINNMLLLLLMLEQAKNFDDEDRKISEDIRLILTGPLTNEIRTQLKDAVQSGSIKKDTFSKFTRLNEYIIDIALKRAENDAWKEFIKQLYKLMAEQDDQKEIIRCSLLGIEVQ